MTIPNIITIARLIAVPVIVLLMLERQFGWAFALFVAAGISDAIDGTIARHVKGQASELGAYLDPIADKALLMAVYVTLGITGSAPLWLIVLVVSRDVLIVGGVVLSWIVSHPVHIDPLKISKANTLMQIVFAATALADLGLAWRLDGLVDVLTFAVAALTIASTAAYVIAWGRHMASPAGTDRPS